MHDTSLEGFETLLYCTKLVTAAGGSISSVVHGAGLEGFETFLYNTSVLYNLLVAYALAQALVLVLMLCSFIQRWSATQHMSNADAICAVLHSA